MSLPTISYVLPLLLALLGCQVEASWPMPAARIMFHEVMILFTWHRLGFGLV